MRKVPYRMAGTTRLVWAIILAQREGLSLLFVQKPDENRSHTMVIAMENPTERIFEDVSTSRFPLTHEDLAEIGSKCAALDDGLSKQEFKRMFDSDDFL
jgi:hypothetical protein